MRNFKLPSMQRRQSPIYNGTLESFVWFKDEFYINVFVSLNFVCAVSLLIKRNGKTRRNKLFSKNCGIFHIFDLITVSRAGISL